MTKIVDTRQDSPTLGLMVKDWNTSVKPTNTPSQTPQNGLIKGYDTNANYNPVYVQPGKYYPGVSLYPKETSAITPEQMTSANNIKLPSMPQEDFSGANSLVAGAGQTMEGLMKLLEVPKTETDVKYQSFLDEMAGLTEQLGQRGIDQLQAEQQAGLPDLNKQYAVLNSQIQTKIAEYKALEQKAENQPITMGQIFGQQAQIRKTMASDIGILQAQALGMQGQIQVAQDTVNRAIDLKYSTIDAQLNTKKAQLEALMPELNRQEKQQALAQQLLIDNQMRELEDKKAKEKEIQGVMVEAANAGINDINVLNQISKAGSVAEAIKIYAENKPVDSDLSVADQIKLIEGGYSMDENGKIISTPVDVSGATADDIAEAIKQIESGGNYEAKGASGEYGAYQFMPDTWAEWSKEYAEANNIQQSLKPTEENQDVVAKWKIQQWLSQGLTPQQIAAKWNSGSEFGWENKIGVNAQGVSYNVPNYVNKVVGALSGITGGNLTPIEKQIVENPGLLGTMTPTKAQEVRESLANKGYDLPEVLSFEDKIDLQTNLKKDFNSVAKETKEAMRQIDVMNTSLEEVKKDPTKLNAASQGILVVFQKMLDPTSVVRESEYARSGTGLSLANRMEGAIEKLRRGGAGLTIENLEQFVEIGNQYFNNIYKPAIQDEANLVKDTADEYGLNLELILTKDILNLLSETGGDNDNPLGLELNNNDDPLGLF